MTYLTTRLRPTLIAVLATVIASFGATATAGTALAASHHHHSSRRHHSTHHSKHHSTHHSGIPQCNVGDNDADNHGGPSDGDGNI
jgi:hypothetical protein